jgi:nitroreductase
MDVGFMGENFHLASAALGLGACSAAGFADDALERLIDVDGRSEMLMLLMGIGHPAV